MWGSQQMTAEHLGVSCGRTGFGWSWWVSSSSVYSVISWPGLTTWPQSYLAAGQGSMSGSFLWQKEPVNIYIPHEHTKEHQGTWEISPWLPLGRHHQKVKSLQHLQQQNHFPSWDSRSLTDVSRSLPGSRRCLKGIMGAERAWLRGLLFKMWKDKKSIWSTPACFLAEAADRNLIVLSQLQGMAGGILQCRIERVLLKY